MGNSIRRCATVYCQANTTIVLEAEDVAVDPSLNPTWEWVIVAQPLLLGFPTGFITDNGDGTADFFANQAGCFTIRVRCKFDRNAKVI